MIELRDDQRRRLWRHEELSLGTIAVLSATYSGEVDLRELPEGRALLAEPRELLASVAVTAAAGANETSRRVQARAVGGLVRLDWEDFLAIRILQALRRRTLPFEPEDVELVLDLGASTIAPDSGFGRAWETLSFGTSAAARLLRVQPGSAPIVGALGRAGAAIEDLGMVAFHTYGVSPLRARIRALLAASVPGGLLDLSSIRDDDEWGPLAAGALRLHATRWEHAQDFLALLARATASRPTKKWRRESSELSTGYPEYGDLLRALLEPVLEIDPVPSGVGMPSVWLLTPENGILARGAVWATADVHADWVVPLLGRLALRGAARSPTEKETAALSATIAGAAIGALAEIGTEPALAELRALLGEIQRRDILKRIAAIVGEDESVTGARDERIRREKERAVREQMRDEQSPDQHRLSSFVRGELGRKLRSAGFDRSKGRTFWRTLDDRVERVDCRVQRDELTLWLRIGLDFVPHVAAVVDDATRPPDADDLGGRLPVDTDDATSIVEWVEEWFARWRDLTHVRDWLLERESADEVFGWGEPGSPERSLPLGYVARELGDVAVARLHLHAAAAFYRERVTDASTPEFLAWLEMLESDAEAA